MHAMFRHGRFARTAARESSRFNSAPQGGPDTSRFPDDTLGGWVTFDTFQKIIDTDLS